MNIKIKMDFKETIKHISKQLDKVPYDNGDISDIGNEIGFSLGSKIENMSEEQIEDFITGFRHGVSLTNNTH
jgi:2-keto-4-pentenoate hydratase/2-oxohepta-3-ene-1,7-dioic acid hydratase in catechol pathway